MWLPAPAGAMPIATIKDGAVLAVTADHLNTPRRLTASNGALVWQWGYSPSGDEAPTVAARKFAKVAAVDGDIAFNLRYSRQYFDKESGLHYNGFRTYNPQTGRYTQGDPIGLDGGWNRFGYVGANPLIYTDPKGLNAQVVGPAMTMLPILAIGYATNAGIRDTVNGMARRCGNAVARVKNWMFSEEADSNGASKGKSRNKPPSPLIEAEGRPHSIIEEPGNEGQYTTHNSDGTSKQYRGSGNDHGGIPRPNVKESGKNVAPDGRELTKVAFDQRYLVRSEQRASC